MARVLKVIVNVMLICSILTAGALLVPPIAGVTTVIVDSSEKTTNLGLGTVTYAKEKPISEIEVGDTILKDSSEGSFVYIVKAIDKETGSYTLQDKFNKEAQPITEVVRNTMLKVVVVVPAIGYVVMAMQSMEGLIIISLIVVFVIVLFILSELWKSSDNEEDEDEEDELEDQEEEYLEKDDLSKKERKALAKAEKKKEKALKKAKKNAQKFGGSVENYLDEEVSSLNSTVEVKPEAVVHDSVENILAVTTGELAKEIGAVTGEIPVIDESVLEVSQDQPAIEEEQVKEEPVKVDVEASIVMPRYTAEELIQKALAEGEHPKIVEDKENDITLIDYSDILKS